VKKLRGQAHAYDRFATAQRFDLQKRNDGLELATGPPVRATRREGRCAMLSRPVFSPDRLRG